MERRSRTAERPQSTEKVEWIMLMEEALNMEGSAGRSYNRFYEYSFLNQVLLASQGVREPVATYRRWQELGRQVRKGSKAKAILRPLPFKVKNELGEEETRVKGFKMVNCLFPVSDTDGEPLTDVEPKLWSKERALGALAIREVAFAGLDGNVAGYSVGRDFAVSPVASYPKKTLFHELGHIVLGHTSPEQIEEYSRHRGIAEFQAESVAYLSMNELEMTDHMDAAESRHYIQTWLRDEQPDDASIRQVFSATDKILRAGRVIGDGTQEEV